ncbi:MAG: hypothetical protein COT73_11480 [Bdellovibrio sp. CG10_big_fil_rev_8_21_14_0_10_47_8]|nr:MAG: hypothetical protein COT73_11480 [Bdellovibrio sp. CG10_big_fil_rev_8_21_14_0_10_47_8]
MCLIMKGFFEKKYFRQKSSLAHFSLDLGWGQARLWSFGQKKTPESERSGVLVGNLTRHCYQRREVTY